MWSCRQLAQESMKSEWYIPFVITLGDVFDQDFFLDFLGILFDTILALLSGNDLGLHHGNIAGVRRAERMREWHIDCDL